MYSANNITPEVTMSFLPWKEEYSVSVKKFDEQHKKLFELIDELADAISSVEEHAVMRNIVRELIDYTRVHFRDEELNLQLYEYPEYREHKLEHDDLTKQVVDFALEFCSRPELANNLMNFLKKWITKHILEDDMKYAAYMEGREIIEWK